MKNAKNPVHPVNLINRVEVIFLEKDVKCYPWVASFLARCHTAKVVEISDIREVIENQSGLPYPLDRDGFKRLLVGKQRGSFVKLCPCSPETVHCGYYFLNVGLGCPIACSYCFLQGFLNTSFPVLYVNFEDMEKELEALHEKASEQNQVIRIGTGEMTDSLIFEPLTGYGRHLATLFARWPYLLLELKTKTVFIETLLDIAIPNVVLAWSLNPEEIAQIEESCAPSCEERLEAAYTAVKAGYHVAFHFDPIIAYKDWEKSYHKLLATLFHKIPFSKVAWVSLGTFRIFPGLRDTIRSHHPHSKTLLSELVIGYDGKLRYFKKHRLEIYQKMRSWIQELGHPTVPVYLCMESRDMWEKFEFVAGYTPTS
jgi:spore photoproduct lyase